MKFAAKDGGGNWLFDLEASDEAEAIAEAKKKSQSVVSVEIVSQNDEHTGRA